MAKRQTDSDRLNESEIMDVKTYVEKEFVDVPKILKETFVHLNKGILATVKDWREKMNLFVNEKA